MKINMKCSLLLLSAILVFTVQAQQDNGGSQSGNGMTSTNGNSNVGLDDDIPMACRQACTALETLTERCDDSTDDDNNYFNCVCSAQDASTQFTECSDCVLANRGQPSNNASNNDDNDDDDDDYYDDLRELSQRCNFAIATMTGSTSTMSGMTSTQASSTTTTPTGAAAATSQISSVVSPSNTAVPTAGNANAGARLGVSAAALAPALLLPILAFA